MSYGDKYYFGTGTGLHSWWWPKTTDVDFCTGRPIVWTYPAYRVIERYDTRGKLIERITEPV